MYTYNSIFSELSHSFFFSFYKYTQTSQLLFFSYVSRIYGIFAHRLDHFNDVWCSEQIIERVRTEFSPYFRKLFPREPTYFRKYLLLKRPYSMVLPVDEGPNISSI